MKWNVCYVSQLIRWEILGKYQKWLLILITGKNDLLILTLVHHYKVKAAAGIETTILGHYVDFSQLLISMLRIIC